MEREKLIRASEVKAKLKAFHDWFGGPVQMPGDILARKVIEKCIEEIDKLEPVDRWIKATEQPPEKYKKVLVKDRITGEVTTAYWSDYDCFVFADGRGHGADLWMPLPV